MLGPPPPLVPRPAHSPSRASPARDRFCPPARRGTPGARGQQQGANSLTAEDVERRSRLAGYLDRSAFPAARQQLVDDAAANHAPDDVMAELARLPDGREFGNVNEVWTTLGGGAEAHRF